MSVTINITKEQRENLLCSAIEGGSNYWYYFNTKSCQAIDNIAPKDGKTPFVDRLYTALEKGLTVAVQDCDTMKTIGQLSIESIEKGEQLMADKYADDFADIVADTDDANTADIWFQLAVIGRVEYC